MVSDKKTKTCKCGCGKFFSGSGKYAFEWHDPNIIKHFQERARRYAYRKYQILEDRQDFTSFAVSEFIRRGYANCKNLFVDWCRKTKSTRGLRTWKNKELFYAANNPISIEKVEHLLSCSPNDIEDKTQSEIWQKTVEAFTGRMAEIADLYILGVQRKSIAQLTGITASRVSQLLNRIKAEYYKTYAHQAALGAASFKPIETEFEIEWITI